MLWNFNDSEYSSRWKKAVEERGKNYLQVHRAVKTDCAGANVVWQQLINLCGTNSWHREGDKWHWCEIYLLFYNFTEINLYLAFNLYLQGEKCKIMLRNSTHIYERKDWSLPTWGSLSDYQECMQINLVQVR